MRRKSDAPRERAREREREREGVSRPLSLRVTLTLALALAFVLALTLAHLINFRSDALCFTLSLSLRGFLKSKVAYFK